MTRIKRGVIKKKKHKKIIKKTKGYYGAKSRTYKTALQSIIKSQQYNYRDRKKKKKIFRKLWIIRINAAAKINGTTYSKIINKLKKKSIIINRKILSNIALFDNKSFMKLIQ